MRACARFSSGCASWAVSAARCCSSCRRAGGVTSAGWRRFSTHCRVATNTPSSCATRAGTGRRCTRCCAATTPRSASTSWPGSSRRTRSPPTLPMCVCTGRPPGPMAARIPSARSPLGPARSAAGGGSRACTCTSTTTRPATRCATPRPCGGCSPGESA
ncbi:MAG: mediator of RNA polymerase II transcription subunit 16 [Desulfosudis oleivorans]|nr:mediator of RNA polymerase II transcription subunit 16 [Desulfosudis oleivorans]